MITCVRIRPEIRSGREAGRVHEGVLCSPPRIKPTNHLATGLARVDSGSPVRCVLS